MGVVTRPNSKYFWMNLERPGAKPIRKSTKVLCRGLDPKRLRENRVLADKIYHVAMAELAQARAGVPVDRAHQTFRTYAAWYEAHVTVKKRTRDREASAIKRLVTFFGGYPLARVDRALVLEYRATREGVKNGTINREIDVLKAMLGEAVPTYLPVNPLLGLKRLRARAPEAQTLTREQEAAILKTQDERGRAVLICALDTMMRLGDLVKLTWAQDKGAYFDLYDPKGASYRPVISARLRAALDVLKADPDRSARIFRWLWDENAGKRWFTKACQRAKVPHGRPHGVTFHGLRHTGATRFMQVPGATLTDLMAQGGWRDLKSVMRYQHVSGATRAIVDRMNRAHGVHSASAATRNR